MSRVGYSSENGSGIKKENKKSKKVSMFFKVVFSLYLAISIIFFVYIITVNMLPIQYLVIIGLVFFVIIGVISLGILSKKKTKTLNIVCTILACISAIIYGVMFNYLSTGLSFIDSMSKSFEETEDYYIVVQKDSKYNKIEDINDKDVYIFANDENFDDVKNEIKSKVNVKYKENDNLDTLSNNLLKGKNEVLLLSSIQYSMIIEEKDDFEEKTKKIYTANHKIKSEVNSNIKDESSKHTIESGVFNVYISGIDTEGSINKIARSDANILATVNTKTHEILLTSIPRDYYVTLHSKKAKDKLTHSGIYGINETITTVEDLLNTDINYYVRVNFTTVIKAVDAIGGIDVNSDFKFSAVGYNFVKGNNHLNGKQALAFSRERHAFADGDRQRGKNQQKVIEAIVKKLTSSTTILTKYNSILNSLSGCFQTNIEQKDISMLVKSQLDNMSSWKITNISLDGTGSNLTTYSGGSQKLYVMIPNEKTVNDAKNKIDAMLDDK